MKRRHKHVMPTVCLLLIIAVTGLAAWQRGVGLGWWPGFAAGLSVAAYAAIEMLYHFLHRETAEFARMQKQFDGQRHGLEQQMLVLSSIATEADKWQTDYLNFVWQMKHHLAEHEDLMLRQPELAVHCMRQLVRGAEAGLKK